LHKLAKIVIRRYTFNIRLANFVDFKDKSQPIVFRKGGSLIGHFLFLVE